MFFDCLQSHLAVCAQRDLPNYTSRDRNFWHLVSIREPKCPEINPDGFLSVHKSIFHDVDSTENLEQTARWIIPTGQHIRDILDYVTSHSGEPILIHCWEGRSRSMAVALTILIRAMLLDGYTHGEIIQEAPEMLLEIRPRAVPNHLMLTLAVQLFLPEEEAKAMVHGLVHHPRLYANRFPGASPG